MNISDKGLVALLSHEGIVPGPYRDSVGVLTYGVGHTKSAGSPDPAALKTGMPANLDAELVEVFEVFEGVKVNRVRKNRGMNALRIE